MSFVNLVSGGLDSTLVGVMVKEEGIEHFPLFIDYGQRAASREWETCELVHDALGLPVPTRMDLSGFGRVIASGLTRQELDVKADAFHAGPQPDVLADGQRVCVSARRIIGDYWPAGRGIQSVPRPETAVCGSGRKHHLRSNGAADQGAHATDRVRQGRRGQAGAGQGHHGHLLVPHRQFRALRTVHRLLGISIR
jgi:hypothetical protein